MDIFSIFVLFLMAFIYVIIITWGILEWKSDSGAWRLALGACASYTFFLIWLCAASYTEIHKEQQKTEQLQNNTVIEQQVK